MQLLRLDEVQPGMLLARSLFDEKGQILLGKGIELSESYLARLKGLGISQVAVEAPGTEDIQIETLISDRLRQQTAFSVRKEFQKQKLDMDVIHKMVNDLVDEIVNNRSMVLQISNLKNYDAYTFQHSVDVCSLGLAFARRLGLDPVRMKKLGVGLLLHDIGKMKIPEAILNKPGKLTEEEFAIIKSHPEVGWELLKNVEDISPLSRAVILQHHEKWDGSGYPQQLTGPKIHLFGRISAIVDVYDAMTSDRIYRARFQPHQALDYIVTAANKHFALDLVQKFLTLVPPYGVGTTLKLSTGQTAVVKDIDINHPTRPTVRVVGSQEELNLSREADVTILEVLS